MKTSKSVSVSVIIVFLFLSLVTSYLLAQFGKVSEVYFDRGVQKYLKGDLDGFIADLEKALEFDPQYKKAKTFLVKILVERGSELYLRKDFKKALPYLERAHNLDPDNKEVAHMYKLTKQELFFILAPAVPRTSSESQEEIIVAPLTEGTTVPVSLKEKGINKDNLMITLFDTFQRQQAKLVESYIEPQETLKKQLENSDRERKEMLIAQNEDRKYLYEMLEKRDQVVMDTFIKQQKDTKRAFIFGIIGIVMSVGVVIFVMYFILYRASCRREAILMQHQERLMILLTEDKRRIDTFLNSESYTLLEAFEHSHIDFRTMIENPNSHIRAKGVELLEAQLVKENSDSEIAEKLLSPFLDDPNNRVKANAVKALYKYNREKSVETAKKMVQSSNTWMRMSGIWVLGEIEDIQGIEFLLDILPNEKEGRVKNRIFKSLTELIDKKSKEIPEDFLARIKTFLEKKDYTK